PSLRHREHLQDLCGELPRPGSPGRHPGRGSGNRQQRSDLYLGGSWGTRFGAARSSNGGIRTMKATALLHNLGQSLWLDNITRDLLNSGTLKSYIDELSVTGLTSNPTIFEHAIKNSTAYDADIRDKLKQGKSEEELFFELALDDLTRAADLFRPIYDNTNGVNGWVSLEVSPLLAYDAAGTLAAAKDLFARARRPNLLIKIPGTKEGL